MLKLISQLVLLFVFIGLAQGSYTWTWLSGNYTGNSKGVYGEKNTTSMFYAPAARRGCASATDSKGNMWIFGGSDSGLMNDFWKFDGYNWTLISGDNTTRDVSSVYGTNGRPGSRGSSTMWIDSKDNIYIYGGTTGEQMTAELWKFNGTHWTCLNGAFYKGSAVYGGTKGVGDSSTTPGARMAAFGWVDLNDHLWLYGGSLSFIDSLNDLWKWNGTVWTWMAGSNTGMNQIPVNGTDLSLNNPSARSYAAGWTDSNSGHLWLFGGQGYDPSGSSATLNDIWRFDGQYWIWIAGSLTANSGAVGKYPKARAGPGFYRTSSEFYVFGGGFLTAVGTDLYSDIWKYNWSSNTWTQLFDSPDNMQGIYTEFPREINNGTAQPGGRYQLGSGGVNNSFYIFGGYSSVDNNYVYMNDMWRFDYHDDIVMIESISTTTEVEIVNQQEKAKKFPYGIVIGISVGGTILLALFIIIIFVLAKRRRSDNNENNENNNNAIIMTSLSSSLEGIVVGEKLGGGQFGEVYKGKWQTSTDVALKKLKSQEQIVEFEREASILKDLRHQNVVQYYGIYVAPNTKLAYIVTEYLPYGSLDQLIQKEDFNETSLLELARDAAAGMLYLSDRTIVHRDLALRNLLVGPRASHGFKYAVKIADFGMSRLMGSSDYYKKDDNMIPYRWCSVEVLSKGKYSTKSDVWSFGVVLWEMFSGGAMPYMGKTNSEVVKSVLNGERLEMPNHCPNEVCKIMVACWHQDPDMRPSFEEILSSIEELLLSNRQSSVSASPKPTRPQRVAKANDAMFYN